MGFATERGISAGSTLFVKAQSSPEKENILFGKRTTFTNDSNNMPFSVSISERQPYEYMWSACPQL